FVFGGVVGRARHHSPGQHLGPFGQSWQVPRQQSLTSNIRIFISTLDQYTRIVAGSIMTREWSMVASLEQEETERKSASRPRGASPFCMLGDSKLSRSAL